MIAGTRRDRGDANVAPALELANRNVALESPIVLAGLEVIVVCGRGSLTAKWKRAGVGSTGPAGDTDLAWNV